MVIEIIHLNVARLIMDGIVQLPESETMLKII